MSRRSAARLARRTRSGLVSRASSSRMLPRPRQGHSYPFQSGRAEFGKSRAMKERLENYEDEFPYIFVSDPVMKKWVVVCVVSPPQSLFFFFLLLFSFSCCLRFLGHFGLLCSRCTSVYHVCAMLLFPKLILIRSQ